MQLTLPLYTDRAAGNSIDPLPKWYIQYSVQDHHILDTVSRQVYLIVSLCFFSSTTDHSCKIVKVPFSQVSIFTTTLQFYFFIKSGSVLRWIAEELNRDLVSDRHLYCNDHLLWFAARLFGWIINSVKYCQPPVQIHWKLQKCYYFYICEYLII